MGTLTLVKNYFDPFVSRDTKFVPEGTIVASLVKEFVPADGYDVVVYLNGNRLTDLSRPVATGDYLTLGVVPQGGGGGKDILRIVAILAVVVISIVAPYMAPAAWGLVGATGALTATGMVFSAAIMIAGGMLVNAVLPPAQPDTSNTDITRSPTYSWDASTNPYTEGGPICALYGTFRIVPPVIGKYVETLNGKQYLNLLFCLADHTIDSVSGIRINGNDLSGFEGVTYMIRPGGVNQAVIPWFNDTRTDTPVGVKLSTSYATRTTSGNIVSTIRVGISAPLGLCYVTDTGALQTVNVDLDVEFKKTGDSTWTRLKSYNESTVVIYTERWSAGHYVTDGNWVEVLAGSTTPADHLEGDVYPSTGYWSWDLGGFTYPDFWHWMPVGTYKAPGTVLYDYVTISGAQTDPIRKTFLRGSLVEGEYDVRVRLHTAPSSGDRYRTDVYWEYLEESVSDDFTYPGRALLGLRAMATDQLAGGIPKIDCLVTRGYVSVYDEDLEALTTKDASNPAWACYDVLHNADYGGNVPYSRIDYYAFKDWAEDCDDKGWTVNIYLDAVKNLRQALNIIGINGRGCVVQLGSKFTVIQDRAADTPVQGFLFSVGNVTKDSFNETWLSLEDRADAIQVIYFDEDLDYSNQMIEIHAPDYDTTTRQTNPASLTLMGCTDRALAIKHGKYMLNATRLLTLTANLDADVDALACRPGDIIEVQHDLPQWGYGGRIVSATSSGVVIDREVTLVPGTSYGIIVRHIDDDTRETQAIQGVGVETTTDTLTLTGTWTKTPAAKTVYSFGVINSITKLFRVQKISRNQDFTRRLQLVEYLSEVYDDAATAPVFAPISDLDFTIGLAAQEVYKGGSSTTVQLTWRGVATLWNVWMQKSSGKQVYLGQTRHPAWEVLSLDYGALYTFHVSHTSHTEDGLSVNITPMGKITIPGDVSTITTTPMEDGVLFEWPKVTDFDLKGYNVRYGLHWMESTAVPLGLQIVPTEGAEYKYVCATAGTTGSSEPTWGSSPVNDGTAVWSLVNPWNAQLVDAEHFKAELGAAEKQIQAKGALYFRIWVRAVDAFGNESETVSTAADQCLNQKAYTITIGADTYDGKYLTIQEALDRMTPGGGTMILKNGIYQLTDQVTIPDVNLDIIGETKNGVTIKNAAGYDCFSFPYGLTKIFRLFNFTIDSQNTSSWMAMVRIGAVSQTLSAEISIDSINFLLNGNQSAFGTGDSGIVAVGGTDDLKITRCTFDQGQTAISIGCTGHTEVVGNHLNLQSAYGILVNSAGPNLKITDNRLIDVWYRGIYCVDTNADASEISRNEIQALKSTSMGMAFYVVGLNANIKNNRIASYQGDDGSGYKRSVYLVLAKSIFAGNVVEIQGSVGTNYTNGLYLKGCTDSRFDGNSVTVDVSAAGVSHIGISLTSTSLRNIVVGNLIDGVRNTADEYGIYIASGSDNNQGSDNVTYRVGTSISDGGSGNTVTAKDV